MHFSATCGLQVIDSSSAKTRLRHYSDRLLVLRPGNMFTKSLHLLKDCIRRGHPRERVRLGIVATNKVLNLGHQVWDAAKGSATDGFWGDEVEPEFDLVEP